jgi:starvation-inducible outer membrane lipoprotein
VILTRIALAALATALLSGCVSYPPPLSPTKGQTAAQQEFDSKDCDHQVHSAARQLGTGMFTAWSENERDQYVACMKNKGYTPTVSK